MSTPGQSTSKIYSRISSEICVSPPRGCSPGCGGGRPTTGYAIDQGRQKAVARQSLEVSTMEADSPTLSWLQASLNAREASQASRSLFAALREA